MTTGVGFNRFRQNRNRAAVISDGIADDLLSVLAHELPHRLGRRFRPVSLSGRYSSYSSTNPLGLLDVDLVDGGRINVVWKDLSPGTRRARAPRPEPLGDPKRELIVYDSVLDGCGLDTARCYGTYEDGPRGIYWLFLEAVPGARLPQAGDPGAWLAAARWLARAHNAYDNRGARARELPHYDAIHFWSLMERAVLQARGTPREALVNELAERYSLVVDRLSCMPATIVHGELYPVNVVVTEAMGSVSRICVVDWETTGVGPAFLDLAALTSGRWTATGRSQLVAAYLEARARVGLGVDGLADALEMVDYCRLLLCVRWLGWSDGWSARADQAHNWLAEAVELSARLVGNGSGQRRLRQATERITRSRRR